MHINADDKQKIQGWAQAKIERVDNDLLSLVFPYLPVETDCDIDRWSTDIAQFEAKTAEDYAWRRENLAKLDLVDFLVDCHDKFKWEESTLFKTFEDNSGGRPVLYANTGFRVYRNCAQTNVVSTTVGRASMMRTSQSSTQEFNLI